METNVIITILENQLEESSFGTDMYKIRLRRTIDQLKSGYYLKDEEKLITDLESLGFTDVARQVRSGQYL